MTSDSLGVALSASLQDTVLHIALLAQGAPIPEIHVWRARCIGLVERLAQAMYDDGWESDVVRDVGLAQCALLDEVTFHYLPVGRRDQWMRETMLFRFHRLHSGADRIRARVDVLLNAVHPDQSLLDMYATLFELGLPHERDEFRDRLSMARRVASSVDSSADGAWVAPTSLCATVPVGGWLSLRWGLLAVALLAGVWLAVDISLRHAVERLPDLGAGVAHDGKEVRM